MYENDDWQWQLRWGKIDTSVQFQGCFLVHMIGLYQYKTAKLSVAGSGKAYWGWEAWCLNFNFLPSFSEIISSLLFSPRNQQDG